MSAPNDAEIPAFDDDDDDDGGADDFASEHETTEVDDDTDDGSEAHGDVPTSRGRHWKRGG